MRRAGLGEASNRRNATTQPFSLREKVAEGRMRERREEAPIFHPEKTRNELADLRAGLTPHPRPLSRKGRGGTRI